MFLQNPVVAATLRHCDILKQLIYFKINVFFKIKPLALLINQILNTVIFPDMREITKVIPILKIGDEASFCNYIRYLCYQ